MVAIVSESRDYVSFTDGRRIDADNIDFVSRMFYMQEMHKTYSATATVCTGAAALIEGTVVNQACGAGTAEKKTIRIGHPAGIISVEMEVERKNGEIHAQEGRAGKNLETAHGGIRLCPGKTVPIAENHRVLS